MSPRKAAIAWFWLGYLIGLATAISVTLFLGQERYLEAVLAALPAAVWLALTVWVLVVRKRGGK